MGTTIKQEFSVVLPTGTYPAQIVAADLDEGHYGAQVKLTFNVIDGEHKNATLMAWTSAKFSQRSKLFRWVKAAFGGTEIPPTYDLDLDHLLDRRVMVQVVEKTKEDGTEFNKVDEVRPYRPNAAPQGAPQLMPQAMPLPAATPPATAQPAGGNGATFPAGGDDAIPF